MRVGLYIGNFNPPHYGHQYTALYAMEAANLSELAFIPRFKRFDGKKMEDWIHRCHLTRLAVWPFNNFIYVMSNVDRRAWDEGGTGLISETIAAWRAERPDTTPVISSMLRSGLSTKPMPTGPLFKTK